MAIPQHICVALGCAGDLDSGQLGAHLEGLSSLPWFLSDQVVRGVFCEAVFDETKRLLVEVHPVHGDIDLLRYLEITKVGNEFNSLLAIPSSVNDGVARVYRVSCGNPASPRGHWPAAIG